MSTYWGFRCKQDQELQTYFQGSPERARLCLDIWPQVKVIRERDHDLDISIEVLGDDRSAHEGSIWDFLAEHYDHGVEICNEYGLQEKAMGLFLPRLPPGEWHTIKFEQPKNISILQPPAGQLELKRIIPLMKKCDPARLKRLQKALQLVIDIFIDDDDQAL